jgi:hypothetical protein
MLLEDKPRFVLAAREHQLDVHLRTIGCHESDSANREETYLVHRSRIGTRLLAELLKLAARR